MINTEACGFDGGDCGVDAEIFSTIVPTEDGTDQPTEDTTSTQEEEESGVSLSSSNLTLPSPDVYPNCTIPLNFPDAPHYPMPQIGNGHCDYPLNNADCGFDEGDCDVFNELFPNCVPNKMETIWLELVMDGVPVEYWWPYWLKDGFCDPDCNVSRAQLPYLQSTVNTPECNFDDGDCIEFNAKYPDCHTNYPMAVGDMYCDCLDNPELYTEECGWDGGDCVGMEDACEEGMEEATMDPTEEEDDDGETFAPSADDLATEQPLDAATTSHPAATLRIALIAFL
ncbi:MAG: hypothetical protein SGARI_003735, partial [Bacillariaceae sp.]